MANALTLRIVQDSIYAAQADIASAKAEIAAATKRIEVLHGEIGDLLAAARVLTRMDGVSDAATTVAQMVAASPADDFDPNERAGNPYRPSTNKAFMWKALADADRLWLNANEIQELASRLKGNEIPMSSVSPGLSDMKQDGSIERDGMKVALKSRLNENGPPEGDPDAEGVAAPSIKTQSVHDLLG